ncbi:hypothetical protein [Arthrobacter bussei]|uniref:N-acetyltransferase domain-containing protein n=1 Tax=Arthrobacter bussei TaxID=2594179 RepID=A0A7X1NMW9_9MICC|nr:hypothetical protein [Arthrobacter bussei]MPY09696.1 hypothetical protein [Arthrobacter bussei]
MSGVVAAVGNNADWCSAVCRAHDVPVTVWNGIWRTGTTPPRFYPDAMTLRPGQTSSALVEGLGDRPACAVKDGWASLDLRAAGFEPVFTVSWIRRMPDDAAGTALAWTRVDDRPGAAAWEDAAELPGLLRPGLLGETAVRILLARDGATVVGGAILFRSASVVGLSNVFTTPEARGAVWGDLPALAQATDAGVPVVGYEHGADLDLARGAGFQPIGQLRVWRRGGEDR